MREGIFEEWRNARDDAEGCAEEGDRAGWQIAHDLAQSLEDEIFAATGERPPYGKGWGTALRG
jgi:hypothetical protein